MCGIVAALASRPITSVLVEGLKRLEYRGYDSSGVALLSPKWLEITRAVGKVSVLHECLTRSPSLDRIGIAHTRWATHGVPAERNSHPHRSDTVAVVHNGIIENHSELRTSLQLKGYQFTSETDTEVVAHLIQDSLKGASSLLTAVEMSLPQLKGAFALAIIAEGFDEIILTRRGSPLVIWVGQGEFFGASDPLALLPVTNQFIFLEEGDIARISLTGYEIFHDGEKVERAIRTSEMSATSIEKGEYPHFMIKEIMEQGEALHRTLEWRIGEGTILPGIFGPRTEEILSQVQRIRIIACGTSAHAGMVSLYGFESLAGIPTVCELASEFRYRQSVIESGTLIIAISQSGETADTLEAIRHAKSQSWVLAVLAICNAPESTLMRESDLTLLTRAGPERSVASTKAFTTQLLSLLLVTLALAKVRAKMDASHEASLVKSLHALPTIIEKTLQLRPEITEIARTLTEATSALFIARWLLSPVALEWALKLKEISYIHAEGYAAGELKHGPLALIDRYMPVIALSDGGALEAKLLSNLQEVMARGGRVIVFSPNIAPLAGVISLQVPQMDSLLMPIILSIPLQLLAYDVAVLKGTDVDQPRNLAKSVTVE